MRRIWRGFKALLLVALGAGLAIGLGQCGKNKFPTNWFTIEQPSPHKPKEGGAEQYGGRTSYSTDIIMKAEKKNAPVPEIVGLSGKAKFLTSGQRGDSYEVPIGYEVELTLSSEEQIADWLDRRRQQGANISNEPLKFPEDVTFRVDFVLKDKDGFVLQEAQGESHYIKLGTTKELKGITTNSIGSANALATKSIECEVFLSDMSFKEDIIDISEVVAPSEKPQDAQ